MSAIADSASRPRSSGAGEALLQSVTPVLLGAFVIALPVALHLASHALAILVCVLLGLTVAVFVTPTVPVVLIVAYLFQNLFVALVSPEITSIDELNSIRGYNFLLTAVIWAVLVLSYWTARQDFDRGMQRLMDLTTAAFVVIGIYFCLGLAVSPMGAVVYLRNIATPFMLLQIFALVAYRSRVDITGPVTLIALIAVAYGYVELVCQGALYSLVHGDTYLTLGMRDSMDSGYWARQVHDTGFVLRSYLDTMKIDLLNTPLLADWNITLSRIVGPNFHSISFAYCLAGLAIMLSATGRWWFTLLILPLVLAISSKGALVLLLLVSVALLLISYVPAARRLWLYVALLACYAALGVVTGIGNQDYHVIGFIGGLRGFLSNPIGHGIGAGGNLATNIAVLDWSQAQGLGHTDIAVESAIGVLLFQVGVAAFGLLAIFVWIARKLWTLYLCSLNPIFAAAAIAIITILVNGIFQEEALFAPLALGLFTAFAGLLLGSVYREQDEDSLAAFRRI